MNILYCGDKNIEDGLIISVLSLLKNVDEELKLYIITMSLQYGGKQYYPVGEETIDYLQKRMKEKNATSEIIKYDISDMFINEMPAKNLNTRFTPFCMLRLFADEIAELPDKLLYLDNDVICRQDFSEFYHQDMTDTEIAGALDYYGKWFFKKNLFKFDYINSGVLLLNLTQIKETGLFRKCREMCISKEMFMPDQSAINKLSTSKRICAGKYNEQRRLHTETVFQHFTTSFRLFPWLHTLTVKPWQIEKMHEQLGIFEYDDLLDDYIDAINIIRE